MASDSDTEFRQNHHKKRKAKAARQLNDTDSEEDSPVEAQLKHKARIESESSVSGSSEEDGSESGSSESEHEGEGGEGEGGQQSGGEEGEEEEESSSSSEWETGEEDEGEEVTTASKKAKGPVASATGEQEYSSDSSDGQSEKCPICLMRFSGQDIGTPESCDHSFCLLCIQQWAKNINTCPVDRQPFYLIFVRKKLEGKIVNRIPIEKCTPAEEEEVIDEDPTYCEVCGLCDREDRLLLCDGCDLGYHMECLEPPLDVVPLEEWYCQDCNQTNNSALADEVDFEQDELFDLLEDAPPVDLPPRRARQNALIRLVPRTRQYERVRRQIRTRQRAARSEMPLSPEHSLPDEAESPSTSSTVRRTATARPKTRKRKIRRKGTRRKRKTTTRRKRKTKTTTTTSKDGTTTTVKKRKYKRKKRKIRKKKVSRRRRVVRPAAVPKSVRGRLAGQLGMLAMKNGQTVPLVKPTAGKPTLDYQRSNAGIPTLRIFGSRHELDLVSSGSEDSGNELAVQRIARPRIIQSRAIARVKAVAALSRLPRSPLTASPPGRSPARPRESAASDRILVNGGSQVTFDVLGGILEKQSEFLQTKRNEVTIKRDGSILNIKNSSDKVSALASKPPSIVSNRVPNSAKGVSSRNSDTSSNTSRGSSRSIVPLLNNNSGSNVSSRPLHPTGGNNSNHGHGGDHMGGDDGRPLSNNSGGYGQPISTTYDPHGSRAYSNYLSSGSSSVGGSFGDFPGEFNALGGGSRHIGDFADDDENTAARRSSKSSDKGSNKGKNETEDEDIDIYSDIEPGTEAIDFENCNDNDIPLSQSLEEDAIHSNSELGDELGDEREHSDSELIIDDNAQHEGGQATESEKYDPAEPSTDPYSPTGNLDLSNVSQSSVPDSEKYDPADPSYDSDDNEFPHGAFTELPSPDKNNSEEESAPEPSMENENENENEEIEDEVEKINANVPEDRYKFFRNIPLPPSPGTNSLVVRSGYSSVNDYSESRTSTPTNDEDYDRIGSQGRQPVQYSDSGNIVEYSDSDSETTSRLMTTTSSLIPPLQAQSITDSLVSDTINRTEQDDAVDKTLESNDKDDSFETKSGATTSEKDSETDLKADDSQIKSAAIKETRPSILEEIFGSDSENESSAKPKQQEQSTLGLENLETETISETEETNFDDLEEGGENIEEGEIPTKNKGKKKQPKQRQTNITERIVREIPSVLSLHRSVHLRLGRGPHHGEGDYEEGEIVDDKPKPKRDKKKETRKHERENRVTDENFNALHFTEEANKRKRKRSGSPDVRRDISSSNATKRFTERPVLASSENKKESTSTTRKRGLVSTVTSSSAKVASSSSNISWKKLSKSSRDRNYRDGKPKDSESYFNKERESKRKRDGYGGDSSRSRERKKKEKRKDLERYDVRKVVSERSRREAERKRKDEFGRDVSRERTHSRSKSHDRSRRSREERREKSHSRERERARSHSKEYDTSRYRSYSRSWTPSWDSRSYSRSPTPVHSKHRHSYSYSPESHSPYYKDKHHTSSWSEKKHDSHRDKAKYTRTTTTTTSKRVKPAKEAPVPKKKDKKDKKRDKKDEVPVTSNTSSRKKEEVREKKKKKKEKSPAPSKEVFASGDNILVSVNFNKTKTNTSNAVASATLNKEVVQRSERKKKDTSESDRDGRKLKKEEKKDKNKDRSPKRRRLEPSFEQSKKVVPPPQMSTPITQGKPVLKRKQVIIDLEMSPIQEVSPSPEAVIVLSDSDSERAARDVEGREGRIPKSPLALSMSTGPKTPPEPQVKFSITSKPQLRTITNPLCDDEADDGEDQSEATPLSTTPAVISPAQPRGPSTPTSERPATPMSPGTPEADAYDPFDPTKSPSQSPRKSPEPPSSPPQPLPLANTVEASSSAKDERPALPPEPEKPPLPVEPEPAEKSPEPISVVAADEKIPVSENSQVVPIPQQTLAVPVTQQSKSSSPTVTTTSSTTTSVQTPVNSAQATIPSVVSTAGSRGSLFTSLPPNVANVLCNPLAQGIFTTTQQVSTAGPAVLQPQLHGSPLVSSVVPAIFSTATTVPISAAVSTDKHASGRAPITQNGEMRVQLDTIDVVDMDLESPYSPASSEGDDLFEPPDKPPSPDYSPLDAAIEQRMAAIVKGGGILGKSRTPHKTQQAKAQPTATGDKFDILFGGSAPAPRKAGKASQNQSARSNKAHKADGKGASGKWKGSGSQKQHVKVQGGKGAGGKKEIAIRMDEDQLKIMDDLPSSAVEMQVKEKYLKKLNRQERVVEEVKLSLKPHYTKKHISKEEYKDILRKSVPKICHNRSGEINPIKIAHLVEAYVRKTRYQRKKDKPQNSVKGKA